LILKQVFGSNLVEQSDSFDFAIINQKLSIRMVAGFREVAETQRFFGCGGLQPSEFASPALQIGID
jgi:hypothetical protein